MRTEKVPVIGTAILLILHNTNAFTHIPRKEIIRTRNKYNVIDQTGKWSRLYFSIDLPLLTTTIFVGAATTWWWNGEGGRAKRAQYLEWEKREKEYILERERLASIEPRELWGLNDLLKYNGEDESGPILLAVKGDVFNVWKGRHFYGKGGEYHIMAGRDASRLLAKNRLEEESEDELNNPLNIGERANLEAWYWKFKNKYDLVGRLEGYDPKSMEM